MDLELSIARERAYVWSVRPAMCDVRMRADTRSFHWKFSYFSRERGGDTSWISILTRAVGISLRNPTAIIAREGERPFYPFPSLSGFTTQNL